MQKTIVFILSSNFSGSHFLSLLLGSHSKASHLGEVKNLVKVKNIGQKASDNNESSRQCYICEGESNCKITTNLHNLQSGDIYPTIFSRHDSTITHLIDASKKTAWARRFIEDPSYNIKLIHLVRDPRALVRKWNLHYSDLTRQKFKQICNYPRKAIKILFSDAWLTYSLKWVDQNYKIHKFIDSSKLDNKIVSYEELATNPESTISSLMEWLELDFETTQINYWEHEHHGTQKQKYNSNIGEKEKFIDLQWKKDLPSAEQKKIACYLGILEITSSLGLVITENGLIHK